MAISQKIKNFMERASWIRKMFEEGNRLKAEMGPDKVFDFSLGNPEVEPPTEFKEELKRAIESTETGLHRYMANAGYAETREAVADYLKQETGLNFEGDLVVMTCGAAGGLNVVLKSLLDEGDEVIILSPFFVEYKFYIDNHGGIAKVVPTADDFSLDIDALRREVSERTKAIIINSPNNPTGRMYSSESLSKLGELLEEKGGNTYLISDEPYKKIIYDNRRFASILNAYRRSIVVSSYSKDLSIPGERIGYTAVSPLMEEGRDLIEAMTFSNRTLGFVNSPALMQRVVKNLQYVSVDVREYQEKRDILYNELTDMGYSMVKPEGAFYLFPRSPIEDDIQFVRILQKKNILTVPGSGFGTPGFFRIAYCVKKETIINSLNGFKGALRKCGG